MNRVSVLACLLLSFGLPNFAVSAENLSDKSADVKVRLDEYAGPATVHSQRIDRYKVRIDVDPKTESKELAIRIELPNTGRNTWPAADVEVIDSKGRALPVRRNGIEWHNLLVSVSAVQSTYVVHVVEPPNLQPRLPAEKERHIADPVSGLSTAIANWHDGRQAAISIRFDDSHETHLSKAIPLLREYGFRGTFMINPGEHDPNSRRRFAFQQHRAEWEACALRNDQEFANHTMHHRGALNDADMEYQIGAASKIIWDLFPGQSKLLALNLGGGTQWLTTKTLRYYLDKYYLFDASSGSMGMDDVYGNRIHALRQHLQRHIKNAGWCRIHYHSIGKDFNCSDTNFRKALETINEYKSQLWIAGMADIYKYQTERKESKLTLVNSDRDHLSLKLVCLSDVELYNQPLTLEVTLPKSWPPNRVLVKNLQGKAITTRIAQDSNPTLLRFEVAPLDANYTIELATE